MPPQSHKNLLILASTSPYRKLLLERLGIRFDVASPKVNETALVGEHPGALVSRLARLKSEAISTRYPDAIVIGSDQVAECDGRIVGKPGNRERALRQLRAFSGKTVRFLTAVHIRCENRPFEFNETVATHAVFRDLADDEINRYLDRDKPFDCAGSFKSEQAGISLLDSLESADPTAIVGLPLIATAAALRAAGFPVP